MAELTMTDSTARTAGLSDREYVNLQVQMLKLARTTYEPQMRDIADQLIPYRLRLQLSDYNRGDRRNLRMFDSTAAYAVDTFESGFLSAASDPASQWVAMTTTDPDRANYGPHREWLDYVTQVQLDMMNESNTYVSLSTGYGNMAGFGQFAMSLTESFKGPTINTDIYPTGSYWMAQDDEANVNTFYEEIRMTVRQVYEEFGDSGTFSSQLQNLVDHSFWDRWIDVGHMIQPNLKENPGSKFSKDKPWASWWFELGSGANLGAYGYTGSIVSSNNFLRKSGFDSFPVMVGRWELTKGDTYAIDCPGMKALGDIKALQSYEKRAAQGVEKIVNPHYLAPVSLQGQADHGFIPGETTYLAVNDQAALRPAHIVPPNFLEPVTQKEEEIRKRIHTAFFTDLFQLFDTLPDKERTATEIMQRKSEKLTKLGKPYARIQREVFRPMLKRIFEIAQKRNLIPPAPPDLQGHLLDYQYNGILAQAQKMSRVQPVERLLQTYVQIAEARPQDPSTWDTINLDRAFPEIADGLNVPPDIMNSPEAMQAIRAQRAQQQAIQQKVAMAGELAKAAKNAAGAPTDTKNALTDLVGAKGTGGI